MSALDVADPTPLGTVLAYHERTKHRPGGYARSLGYLDWATQPEPFRRYEGAPLCPLTRFADAGGPRWREVLAGDRAPTATVGGEAVARLFFDSLALSAWKEAGSARWALRVNPSSGNLHPTEGYLLCGPVAGLCESPSLFHYSPYHHALEQRAELPAPGWTALASQLPPGAILVGLTSVHWREAWKYGERAFRYCQHDVGHAIGAVALSAAALGWEARVLGGVTDDALGTLLGIAAQRGVEAEHPDCLLAVYPRGAVWPGPDHSGGAQDEARVAMPPALLEHLVATPLRGSPNVLSADHHDWEAIGEVALATRIDEAQARAQFPAFYPGSALAALLPGDPAESPEARALIRQRRSAVDMDGKTGLSRDGFYELLAATVPGAARQPYVALPGRPRIHLLLFVHRVADLSPGLYLLARDAAAVPALRAAIPAFASWERPPGCPEALPLFCLEPGEARGLGRAVSCGQDIAANGVFAAGMLAEYEGTLRDLGPSLYRRLHWEAGLVGQVLYLEAEALGLRGTGIGCFFDDLVHESLEFGASRTFQTLYHFTVGGFVDDHRLRTGPAYAHLEPPRG